MQLSVLCLDEKEGLERSRVEEYHLCFLNFSSWACLRLQRQSSQMQSRDHGAQVSLNWPLALAEITRSYSLKRRCLGDEGLIGSVESPRCFCSASRAQDEIKNGGWLGAWMAQSIFKKHLCPSVRPQKTGTAWFLVSLHGGGFLLSCLCLRAVSLYPDSFVCAALHSFLPSKSHSLLISSNRYSHFSFPVRFMSTVLPLYTILLLHTAIPTTLFLFLSFSPFSSPPPDFPRCKWQTSRVV